MAALKDPRVKSTTTEIAKALTGHYRAEHLFVLKQELTLYEVYQQQIAAIDIEIEKCLESFEPKTTDVPPKTKRKRRKKPVGNNRAFDLHGYLYRMTGVDFTRIDGLDVLTVQTILSEVGLDPKRFLSVKHFTSWLDLCPGQRITGGKVKSSKTRPVVNRAANAFRLAASSLKQSRSALGAFYRRIKSRLGAPKAITATAHKLARLFYLTWTQGAEYVDSGLDYYEQQYQESVFHNLKKKASLWALIWLLNLLPPKVFLEDCPTGDAKCDGVEHPPRMRSHPKPTF